MRFSPRLRALLRFVEGRFLADIGTDHAYLPIAACQEGKVEGAVACDLCAGPLAAAKENVKRAGLESQILLRQGYGLQALFDLKVGQRPDCLVISGMGGMNIAEILRDPAACLCGVSRLVLQPQRDVLVVREAVLDLGFGIIDEVVVQDRGRDYTILVAVPRFEEEQCGND